MLASGDYEVITTTPKIEMVFVTENTAFEDMSGSNILYNASTSQLSGSGEYAIEETTFHETYASTSFFQSTSISNVTTIEKDVTINETDMASYSSYSIFVADDHVLLNTTSVESLSSLSGISVDYGVSSVGSVQDYVTSQFSGSGGHKIEKIDFDGISLFADIQSHAFPLTTSYLSTIKQLNQSFTRSKLNEFSVGFVGDIVNYSMLASGDYEVITTTPKIEMVFVTENTTFEEMSGSNILYNVSTSQLSGSGEYAIEETTFHETYASTSFFQSTSISNVTTIEKDVTINETDMASYSSYSSFFGDDHVLLNTTLVESFLSLSGISVDYGVTSVGSVHDYVTSQFSRSDEYTSDKIDFDELFVSAGIQSHAFPPTTSYLSTMKQLNQSFISSKRNAFSFSFKYDLVNHSFHSMLASGGYEAVTTTPEIDLVFVTGETTFLEMSVSNVFHNVATSQFSRCGKHKIEVTTFHESYASTSFYHFTSISNVISFKKVFTVYETALTTVSSYFVGDDFETPNTTSVESFTFFSGISVDYDVFFGGSVQDFFAKKHLGSEVYTVCTIGFYDVHVSTDYQGVFVYKVPFSSTSFLSNFEVFGSDVTAKNKHFPTIFSNSLNYSPYPTFEIGSYRLLHTYLSENLSPLFYNTVPYHVSSSGGVYFNRTEHFTQLVDYEFKTITLPNLFESTGFSIVKSLAVPISVSYAPIKVKYNQHSTTLCANQVSNTLKSNIGKSQDYFTQVTLLSSVVGPFSQAFLTISGNTEADIQTLYSVTSYVFPVGAINFSLSYLISTAFYQSSAESKKEDIYTEETAKIFNVNTSYSVITRTIPSLTKIDFTSNYYLHDQLYTTLSASPVDVILHTVSASKHSLFTKNSQETITHFNTALSYFTLVEADFGSTVFASLLMNRSSRVYGSREYEPVYAATNGFSQMISVMHTSTFQYDAAVYDFTWNFDSTLENQRQISLFKYTTSAYNYTLSSISSNAVVSSKLYVVNTVPSITVLSYSHVFEYSTYYHYADASEFLVAVPNIHTVNDSSHSQLYSMVTDQSATDLSSFASSFLFLRSTRLHSFVTLYTSTVHHKIPTTNSDSTTIDMSSFLVPAISLTYHFNVTNYKSILSARPSTTETLKDTLNVSLYTLLSGVPLFIVTSPFYLPTTSFPKISKTRMLPRNYSEAGLPTAVSILHSLSKKYYSHTTYYDLIINHLNNYTTTEFVYVSSWKEIFSLTEYYTTISAYRTNSLASVPISYNNYSGTPNLFSYGNMDNAFTFFGTTIYNTMLENLPQTFVFTEVQAVSTLYYLESATKQKTLNVTIKQEYLNVKISEVSPFVTGTVLNTDRLLASTEITVLALQTSKKPLHLRPFVNTTFSIKRSFPGFISSTTVYIELTTLSLPITLFSAISLTETLTFTEPVSALVVIAHKMRSSTSRVQVSTFLSKAYTKIQAKTRLSHISPSEKIDYIPEQYSVTNHYADLLATTTITVQLPFKMTTIVYSSTIVATSVPTDISTVFENTTQLDLRNIQNTTGQLVYGYTTRKPTPYTISGKVKTIVEFKLRPTSTYQPRLSQVAFSLTSLYVDNALDISSTQTSPIFRNLPFYTEIYKYVTSSSTNTEVSKVYTDRATLKLPYSTMAGTYHMTHSTISQRQLVANISQIITTYNPFTLIARTPYYLTELTTESLFIPVTTIITTINKIGMDEVLSTVKDQKIYTVSSLLKFTINFVDYNFSVTITTVQNNSVNTETRPFRETYTSINLNRSNMTSELTDKMPNRFVTQKTTKVPIETSMEGIHSLTSHATNIKTTNVTTKSPKLNTTKNSKVQASTRKFIKTDQPELPLQLTTRKEDCPPNACLGGGTCTMDGSEYYCTCPLGLLGKHCEIDDDECFYQQDLCDQLCFNTYGSYECACRKGYVLGEELKRCFDVDECVLEESNNCHQVCSNTEGSYTCSCYDGYTLSSDGRTCEDIDFCLSNPCFNNAPCFSAKGRYHCVCQQGWTGFRCEVDLSIPCRAGWQKFRGFCYQFQRDQQLSWADAEGYCRKYRNATLVSINSRKENKFVHRLAFVFQWIGFTDRDEESKFKWSDNSPVEYENWLANQPNADLTDDDCVVMIPRKNGRWNDVSCGYRLYFTCKTAPIGCTTFPNVPHASLVGARRTYAIGEIVRYTCNDGFISFGSNIIECTKDGRFSKPSFYCVGACRSPPDVSNAYIPGVRNKYDVGSVLKYACRRGYILRGNAFIICQDNLGWSRPRLKCSGTCGKPPAIANAVIVRRTGFRSRLRPLYRPGVTVEYQCKRGFNQEGTRTAIRCLSDGTWQKQRFSCQGACGKPPAIPNAQVLILPRAGFYICDNGYVPIGSTLLKCKRGRWTKPKFRCIRRSRG
ncbi:uncharacterized protein LOC143445056 isoform X2 [Clavelina lepadiformis]|uniref:uncharacterized protein LOC143445056 isoform X2 n=1 Tax=Clavelina lepadiformis TaxID=159417 RepID=UPI0040437FD1